METNVGHHFHFRVTRRSVSGEAGDMDVVRKHLIVMTFQR